MIHYIMASYEDLEAYNGDTEHDMWVDFDNFENTGSTDVVVESDLENFIDNLNDWD